MSKSEHSNKQKNKAGIGASLTSIVLLAVILIAVNYIGSFAVLKADLTEENLFTLSEGTESLLKDLKGKVKLKFYFSKSSDEVPFAYKLYGKRIEEFLEEYIEKSKGKLELEVLDPEPDTDTEVWAVKYGLAAASLPTGQKFYLGLVALSEGREEVIPFFSIDREPFLEYDISQVIVQASVAKKPKIGILSTLPVMSENNMPMAMQQQEQKDWLFIRELKKNYEVASVDQNSANISSDIDLLLVIHPKNLGETTRYAIDQFVLKGGRAIVMVDPACMADTQSDSSNPFAGRMPGSSNLNKLFKAWGVEYNPGNIVADLNLATRLNMGRNGMVNHPLWLSLKEGCFSNDSVASAKLQNMLLPAAGYLSKAENSEHDFIELLHTTDSGNKVSKFKVMTAPDEIVRGLGKEGKKKTLAAIVRGKFQSAFQTPPMPQAKKDESEQDKKMREAKHERLKKNHASVAKKEAAVMIIADADFLQNDYSVRATNFFGSTLLQPINDNLAFIANCSDLLAGSSDLIAVRSRNMANRTFTKVEEIERAAQEKWKEEEVTLTQRLQEIQNRINKLQMQKKGGERLILSAEQRKEIEKARKEKSETLQRRREIRKLLRQDIERLGLKVTFVNMVLMPLLVMIAGAVVYFRKNSRRSML
ncbi:MAG: Gldg family protein [Candidatus Rifleibacteriota bacterium]